MRLSLIIAAWLTFTILMSCSNDPDLSDYIKKSDLLTDVGRLTITIKGESITGIPIDEKIDLQYVLDPSNCAFTKENDSVTYIEFNLINKYNFTRAAEVKIKKTNNDFLLNYLSIYYEQQIKNNSYIDFNIRFSQYFSNGVLFQSTGELHSFWINAFDVTKGLIEGGGKLTGEYEYPDNKMEEIPIYDIKFDFNLLLKEIIIINKY